MLKTIGERSGAGATWLVMVLAAITMIGWWTHSAALVQVRAGWAPMQFNTALSFLLCAFSLWAELRRKRRQSSLASALLAALAFVSLIQYPLDASFGIDTLFVEPFVQDATSHPGRMSPNTGFCFLGLCAAVWARRSVRAWPLAMSGGLSAMVAATGLTTLVIYFLQLPTNIGFRNLTSMALTTALGMFVLACVSLGAALRVHRARFRGISNPWLPGATGLFFVVLAVLLWVSLLAEREKELARENKLLARTLLVQLSGRLEKGLNRLSNAESLEGLAIFSGPVSKSTPATAAQSPNQLAALSVEATFVACGQRPEHLWLGARVGSELRWGQLKLSDLFEAGPAARTWADMGYQVQLLPECLVVERGVDALPTLSLVERKYRFERAEFLVRVWSERSANTVATWLVLLLGLLASAALSLLVMEAQGVVAKKRELEAWIEGAPLGLFLVDQEGQIGRVNHRALEIFDAPLQEVQGSLVESWVPVDQAERHVELRHSFGPSAQPRLMGPEGHVLLRRRDGRVVPVEIAIGPVNIAGRAWVLCAMTNIEVRIKTERALAQSSAELSVANEELKRFSAALSHDLRAPIRGMSTLASFIQEDDGKKLSEESQEHLRLLRHRGRLALDMVDGLLGLARMSSLDEELEPVDVAQLAREAFDLVSAPDGFELRVATSLSQVFTARAALLQVVFNLMANAVRHHDREAGTICFGATQKDEWVEFSVRDDGPGIPSEFREQVFSPFRTLKKKGEGEGVGLGLALVKKRIEVQGGSITLADPAEGRGLVVTFTWPFRLEATAAG